MQTSAQQHREDAPDASKRVGSAANDLAESNLSAGLARSALELERGRGLQAATRERLLTEAMENLQNDLDQAAQVAATEARERRSDKNDASPEELLAELSELRRAWQLAQANANQRGGPNGQRGQPNPNDPNGLRDPNGPRDANGDPDSQRGANGDPNAPRDANDQRGGNQPGGNQPGDSPSDGASSQGGQSGSQSGGNSSNGGQLANNGSWNANGGGNWGGGGPNQWGGYARDWTRGLNGWNPPLASGALRPWADSPEFRQQAEDIARRLRDMVNRMPQNALAPADLSALRQLANRLRRSGKDPMESEYKNMVNLVDQLELAALSASEKTRESAPTRTDRPAADSPEYRETVAEYYRRLGGTQQ
jgi:hypothetical protein